MLKSVGAVLAGFLAATVLVMAATLVATSLMLPPSGPGMMPEPTPTYLAVNLAYSVGAAVAGGWLAARLAGRAPLGHGMALGTILLVLGLVAAALPSDGTKGSQPGWYLYAVALLGWIGATAGGMLRARAADSLR